VSALPSAPPHNLEAEQSVIGSLVLDASTLDAVEERITPQDFYVPEHGIIFAAIRALVRAGEPADAVTLADRLKRKGVLGRVGGAHALAGILESVPSAANAEYYADIIAGHARRRRLIEGGEALTACAADPTSTDDDLAEAIARVQAAGSNGKASHGDTPILICMADVQPRSVDYLWKPWLPLRTLTVWAGDPGMMKSTMALGFAACVTRGFDWPDGSDGPEPGNVLIMSAEDDPETVIRPRLDAAEADTSRVTLLTSVRRQRGGEQVNGFVNLARDLDVLSEAVRQVGGVQLAIIDPLSAYLGGIDTHRNAEVRGVLAPIQAFAEAHDCCVLAVTHLNKSRGTSALHRITGSLAFTAAARVVALVMREGEDGERRLLLCEKNNLAPRPDGFAFAPTVHPGDAACSRRPRSRATASATLRRIGCARCSPTAPWP